MKCLFIQQHIRWLQCSSTTLHSSNAMAMQGTLRPRRLQCRFRTTDKQTIARATQIEFQCDRLATHRWSASLQRCTRSCNRVVSHSHAYTQHTHEKKRKHSRENQECPLCNIINKNFRTHDAPAEPDTVGAAVSQLATHTCRTTFVHQPRGAVRAKPAMGHLIHGPLKLAP